MPTTSARKLADASLDAGVSICDACRRRWRSSSSGTRRRARRRRGRPGCAGVLLHHAAAVARPPQQLEARSGRRDACERLSRRLVIRTEGAVRQRFGHERRQSAASHRIDNVRTPIASRVSNGPELPAEAPPHGAVDIVDRRRRSPARPARRRPASGRASARRNVADLVLAAEQRADAIADVVDRCARRRATASRAGCFGAVRPSSPDRASGSRRPVFLVEALPGLRADPAALDQRVDERRQREATRSLAAQPLGEVARHVREHVDAGDVQRPERRALRPADRRAGDRVDLFDRVLAAAPARANAASAPKRPMRLAMKFGVSFATTTPLPSR